MPAQGVDSATRGVAAPDGRLRVTGPSYLWAPPVTGGGRRNYCCHASGFDGLHGRLSPHPNGAPYELRAGADTERGIVNHGLPDGGARTGGYHLPGGGAALCGLQHLQAGYGVPGVDRHGTPSAYRIGERCVEHRPVPAFTWPGPGRVPGVDAAHRSRGTTPTRRRRLPGNRRPGARPHPGVPRRDEEPPRRVIMTSAPTSAGHRCHGSNGWDAGIALRYGWAKLPAWLGPVSGQLLRGEPLP